MEAFRIKNGISAKRYLGSNGVETAGSEGLVFDLGTAYYDSKSLDVSSQMSFPVSLHLSSDGSKLFVLEGNASVYQYSLSTSGDLSTGSYDSVSFSPLSQMLNPYALSIADSGTKMYIQDYYGPIYQYSLSTAFDLSTASYASKTFDPPQITTQGYGVDFNFDGTKMYTSSATEDAVFQYSLSTAFDISTASYDSVSLSVSSQDGTVYNNRFNSDGTKLYIVGSNTDSVYEYSLSTAYNIGTATYSGNSLSVSNQDTAPFGLTFDNADSSMYVTGNSSDTIYQYTSLVLTQTLDLSTGTTFSFTPSGATTVSFTNPPATGNAIGFSVEVIGNGSAITWPSSVKWHLATAPTATASKELYAFVTTDGGTTYYGKRAAEGVA